MVLQHLLVWTCACFLLVFFSATTNCQRARRPRPAPRGAMERIIHGEVVDITDFPYQVALVVQRGNRRWIACGGSIIRPNVIFTAAHCTHVSEFQPRENVAVLVGANYLNDPRGRIHEVDRMIKHPDFNFQDFDNDFAVITLVRDIAMNSRAQEIPISTRDFLGGTMAMASGWGRTETGRPSKYLRAATLRLENWGRCQRYFPEAFHPQITRNMICVRPSVTTTYFGDSGGPLVINGELVGLVSFGRKLRQNKKTTVFTRVRNFMDFVSDALPFFDDGI